MSINIYEIILILIALFLLVIFPVWGYRAGSKRTIGSTGGLLLGLFLSWIGVIIVYCTKRIDNPPPFYDFKSQSAVADLKKYKDLLDSGQITEAEYNIQKDKIYNP